MKDRKDLFLRLLFPEEEEFKNTVIHRNMVVYGAQGMGKTEFLKYLAYEATERYGKDKVEAVQGHIDDLVTAVGYLPHPVKLLFADDLTGKKCKRMSEFFTIGHKFYMNSGFILTALVIHDFFAIPKPYRNFFNYLVVLNTPTNDYDYNWLKRRVGEKYLKILEKLTMAKMLGKMKEWKLFWTVGNYKGFMKTPMVDYRIKSAKTYRHIEKLFNIGYESEDEDEEEEDEGMEWLLYEEDME